MRNRLLLLSLPLWLAATACERGPTDPPEQGVPEAELRFLRLADNAPPLADTVVSFWAVRGEDREVEIRLLPVGDDTEGEEFLELEVPGGALLEHPDGRRFVRGDSVQITVTVVDPSRFLFRFEPSGLKFDPKQPARLEVSYEWAERDGQGNVGDGEFQFWRQASPGALWFPIGTVKIEDLEEAEADLFGFSRYALASS